MTNSDNSARSAHQKRTQPSHKVFDVVRPGRAPAQATSRPVIVGDKPRVNDPMMNHSVHVVDDAVNALHMPDEPLLMAHNPNAMSENLPPVPPAPTATAPTEARFAQAKAPDIQNPKAPKPVTAPAVPLQHFMPTGPTMPEPVNASPASSTPVSEPTPAYDGTQPINTPVANLVAVDANPPSPSAETKPAQTNASNEPRDAVLDDQAKGDLAALVVEGITEIDDSQGAMQTGGNLSAQARLGVAGSSPQAALDSAAQPQQPVAPTNSQKPLPHLEETDTNGYPTAAEMGHITNAKSSAVVAGDKNRSHLWAWVLTILLLLVIAAVVIDLLLDGGFITMQHVPHTHFF